MAEVTKEDLRVELDRSQKLVEAGIAMRTRCTEHSHFEALQFLWSIVDSEPDRIASALAAEREKAWKDAIAVVKNQWRYPDDDYRAGAIDPDDLVETLEAAPEIRSR